MTSQAVEGYSGLESPEIFEPPSEGARYLLSRVTGISDIDPGDLTQGNVEDFFETEVFPALAIIRARHNQRLERKVSDADAKKALEDRFSEIRYSLRGYGSEQIGAMTGVKPDTIRTNLNRTLRTLKQGDSPYDPQYFQAALAEKFPGYTPRETPKPTAAPKRAGRLPKARVSTTRTPRAQSPVKLTKVGPSDDEARASGSPTEERGGTKDLDQAVKDVDLVRIYLNRIGKRALLSAQDEVDLSKQVEAGLYANDLKGRLSGEDTRGLEKSEKGFVRLRRQKIAREFKEMGLAEVDTKALLIRDLGRIAKDGEAAKNHLIEANLRLVVSLAKRYTGRGMPFIDLIQEGNLGLIRAVEKFDYKKGFKFSTYATWWIRQSITRAMADQGRTVRLPVHLVEDVNKMWRIKRELGQELNREATVEEVAKELDVRPEKVTDWMEISRDIVSLDMRVGDNDDASLGEFIEDELTPDAYESAIASLRRDELDAALGSLSEREAEVLRLRHGLTPDGQVYTLDEIGQIYGKTRERIRQIEAKALAKLRHPSRYGFLRSYLES